MAQVEEWYIEPWLATSLEEHFNSKPVRRGAGNSYSVKTSTTETTVVTVNMLWGCSPIFYRGR